VARIWRRWNLQPWRIETFKVSTDPSSTRKIRDVVGLYLNPPDNAIVLCVDEKSQVGNVPALDRTDASRARAPCGRLVHRRRLGECRVHDRAGRFCLR
jgi:hypothetical protein